MKLKTVFTFFLAILFFGSFAKASDDVPLQLNCHFIKGVVSELPYGFSSLKIVFDKTISAVIQMKYSSANSGHSEVIVTKDYSVKEYLKMNGITSWGFYAQFASEKLSYFYLNRSFIENDEQWTANLNYHNDANESKLAAFDCTPSDGAKSKYLPSSPMSSKLSDSIDLELSRLAQVPKFQTTYPSSSDARRHILTMKTNPSMVFPSDPHFLSVDDFLNLNKVVANEKASDLVVSDLCELGSNPAIEIYDCKRTYSYESKSENNVSLETISVLYFKFNPNFPEESNNMTYLGRDKRFASNSYPF